MNKKIPPWALRAATAEDHALAKEAHRHNRMHIMWPNDNVLQNWAKQHGWPRPFLGFEEAFIAHMLETKEQFERAIKESGIQIHLPKQEYEITGEQIRKFDTLYEERSSSGRPTNWAILVEELREIRRAVEAGVVITIEDAQTIQSWQGFYSWAHGRYHMLEDGYDKWIGDDS
jgi:hypothetical protein